MIFYSIFLIFATMKTKEQAIRYLSRRSYSDSDWQAILQKCHFLYGSGIRKSQRPKQQSTYQEFIDWLECGIGDGAIVRCHNLTGIFCDNGDNTYKMLAHYDEFGKIVVETIPIKLDDVQEIDGTQFYKDLRKQGLQYSVTLAIVFERKLPRPFSKTVYVHNGVRGVGIVKKCIHGTVYFVCGYELKFQTEYSLPLPEVDFFEIDKPGVQKLQAEMNRNSVSFDKKTKTLVDIVCRAGVNETYWYLSDILSICRETDTRTARDTARYDNYNYFLNYNEALDFREQIIAIRKKTIKGIE